MRDAGRLVVILGLGLFAPTSALATAPDTFGMGGRWMGAGGGGVAIVDDGNAALLNPAGLSAIRRPTAAVGYGAGFFQFDKVPPLYWDTNRDGDVDERDPPLNFDANPRVADGVSIAIGRHVGGRFGIGLTAYVPRSYFVRFSMFEPRLPNYILYENRPQRFVAAAGLGGRILPGISLGFSLDLLAKTTLEVAGTINAGLTGSSSGDDLSGVIDELSIEVHRIDLRVVPTVAPVIGMQVDVGELLPALDGLVLGASWHGSIGLNLDVDLDLQANVKIDDVGDLDPYTAAMVAKLSFDMFDHYVPQRLNLGIAYRRSETFAVYGDLRWTDWSRFQVNVARLSGAEITAPFVNLDGKLTEGNRLSYSVRNTWGLRTGADLRLPEVKLPDSKLQYARVSVRGGFGYEPSPLALQSEDTAMLDAARMYFTLGTGLEVYDPFALVDGPLRFDIYGQIHSLASSTLPRQTDTPRAGYPIGASGIPVGGNIFVVGGQWGFDY